MPIQPPIWAEWEATKRSTQLIIDLHMTEVLFPRKQDFFCTQVDPRTVKILNFKS